VIIANPDNIADLKSAIAGLNDVKVDFALQPKPLGMADALLSASALLADEPFISANSNDIFETPAYVQLLDKYHKNSHHSGYLIACELRDYFPGGYLVASENGEISHIVEKPARGRNHRI